MKRNFPCVLAIGLILLLSLYSNTWVEAGMVNIVDYMACGKDGDLWTYNYTAPPGTPGFSVSMVRLTEGTYAGKFKSGDWPNPDGTTLWYIFDRDASHIYLYYVNQLGAINPPRVVEGWQELEKPTANPFNQDPNNPLYLRILPSLAVPAGNFKNVLVVIYLDKNYPPNNYNDFYGLNRHTMPWGVTSIEWFAPNVGQIQGENIDAATGNQVFKFHLASTTVKPKLKAPIVAISDLLLTN